ncbi:MAG: hypothetical protein ICV68_12155 [Pyrinomonadaceae bacterium]|nr:hypothetical protein [Pyrinomonadaceae bacterium]
MKLEVMQAVRMKLKAISCAFFCLLLCAGLSTAQSGEVESGKQKSKPDFSGTWMLDEEQAKQNKRKSGATLDKVTLVISQREPEIKMSRKIVSGGRERTRETVYYSDERGETNYGTTISTKPNPKDEEIKSKTKWKDDKLVTSATVRTAVRGTFFNWEIVEEWKLSPDGKTLTQTTTIKPDPLGSDRIVGSPGRVIYVPAINNKFKRVFRRVSD